MDYEIMSEIPEIHCGTPSNCNPPRPLAMAYVEWQSWQSLYPADVGFCRGTIFEELDMPFIGEEAACDI